MVPTPWSRYLYALMLSGINFYDNSRRINNDLKHQQNPKCRYSGKRTVRTRRDDNRRTIEKVIH